MITCRVHDRKVVYLAEGRVVAHLVKVGRVGFQPGYERAVQNGRRVVQRGRPAGRRNGRVVDLVVNLRRAADVVGQVSGGGSVADDGRNGVGVVAGKSAGAGLEGGGRICVRNVKMKPFPR